MSDIPYVAVDEPPAYLWREEEYLRVEPPVKEPVEKPALST